MRVKIITTLAVVMLCFAIASKPAIASVAVCTKKQSNQASKLYVWHRHGSWTWDQLHVSFLRYGHCSNPDNKGIWNVELTTEYDEAIGELLSNHWKAFSKFSVLANSDAAFKNFVMWHLRKGDIQSLDKIRENAHAKCPATAKSLCSELEGEISKSDDDRKQLNKSMEWNQ